MPSDTEVQTMRLYVIRHGKAEQDSPSGLDADRALKPKGVRQAKFLGQRLAALLAAEKKQPVILSSGYARAIHTATIIQASLNCPLDTARPLECDRSVQGAIELVRQHMAGGASSGGAPGPLILVGHNPQLCELLAALLPSGQDGDVLTLRTGECVALEARTSNFIGGAKVTERIRLEEDEEDAPLAAGNGARKQLR